MIGRSLGILRYRGNRCTESLLDRCVEQIVTCSNTVSQDDCRVEHSNL